MVNWVINYQLLSSNSNHLLSCKKMHCKLRLPMVTSEHQMCSTFLPWNLRGTEHIRSLVKSLVRHLVKLQSLRLYSASRSVSWNQLLVQNLGSSGPHDNLNLLTAQPILLFLCHINQLIFSQQGTRITLWAIYTTCHCLVPCSDPAVYTVV